MKPFILGAPEDVSDISEELLDIIRRGFVKKGDCIIFSEMANIDTNATVDTFQDLTGYECFVNSIVVSFYAKDRFIQNAVALLGPFRKAWAKFFPEIPVSVIISGNFEDAHFRFHVNRPGESWISEDLEGFEEPILLASF